MTIVETPGSVASSPLEWTLSETPDLELGRSDAGEAEQFHQIGGFQGAIAISGLPDGRIAVVNGGTSEVRFFNARGNFLNAAGGLGDGPGEFRVPVLIPYPSNDSLLIFDRRRRLFTLLSESGNGHRSFPLEALDKGRIVGSALGASDSGILMKRGAMPSPVLGEQNHSTTSEIVWINLQSDRNDTLGQFHEHTYSAIVNGVPWHIHVPFTPLPSAAVGSRGVFVSDGSAQVRVFDERAQLKRIFRLSETAQPVAASERESAVAYLSKFLKVSHSEARRLFRGMDVPAVQPSFQNLRVDRMGSVWAERFRLPYDTTQYWVVFDETGVARGTIRLPAGLEVHDIGADYIIGRWRDEDGVEYVRRYRLNRT